MSSRGKTVLITGATGFLGQELCRYFNKQGYRVRALARDLEKSAFLRQCTKGGIFKCALPGDIDPAAFEGEIAAIVHCAYANSTRDHNLAEEVNIVGSERLIQLSREYDVSRFVFISSLSAHDEAESIYGQSKLRVEGMLDPQRDLVIRPGLIAGNGGLFSKMRDSLRRMPVVPLFFGGMQNIQIIQISDLCKATERAVCMGLTGLFKVAIKEPIPIREFYRHLTAGMGKKCYFVHLPGTMSLWALRFLENLGINLPINSENLLGLKKMKTFDTRSDLAKLGINPKFSFNASKSELK